MYSKFFFFRGSCVFGGAEKLGTREKNAAFTWGSFYSGDIGICHQGIGSDVSSAGGSGGGIGKNIFGSTIGNWDLCLYLSTHI